MTDSKDLEAEIHPLKNENRKVQEHLGNPAGKETSVKPPPQSRLSRCRTVAFFLSLFVCLFVVFVVSFIIPCPDRPASQGVWRIDYKAAVAYDFLATEDVNKDRIQDVLFLYKNTNSSRSNFSLSCADEGFSSPCTFVAAVSGANGTVLWERPVAQNRALVECGVPQPGGSGASSACIILGRPGPFIAVDSVTGETLWSHPSSFGGNVSVLSPLLQVPDIDADGVPDLLVITQEENQCRCPLRPHPLRYVASAAPGRPPSWACWHLGGSRCGASGSRCCSRDSKSSPADSSGAVRYLMNVPGKVGEDLLLVSSEACVLLDGQELVPRWTLGAAQVLRKPILGYYKPDTPAMVIENGTGSERQILLLDLSSGAVLWSQALPGLSRDPRSASLPTADHRSAFFFWGLHALAGANQTEPGAAGHHLYMFHPTQPGVLLELANISAPIVTFQVVLLEPSRHAAYILLTGPASPDPPGLVSVAKHKVRDLIPSSKVVHLAEGGPDSDQAVRDRFSRLRYRNEA
ncbi:protein FAM234A isoform X2 [Phocoena sinus]|uniref:Family with sequence similarity 234 member A n=1 Tax=Phocoena sinus TaxID=42100 RepID=A0A8C9BGK8_PHOSS|nr:protein FAM234A isoform X2 [Phocoena sinus]